MTFYDVIMPICPLILSEHCSLVLEHMLCGMGQDTDLLSLPLFSCLQAAG